MTNRQRRSPKPFGPRVYGTDEAFEPAQMKRLQMFLCLIPVVGFFPALWTLYRDGGDRNQKAVSRLAVTLALGWVLGYFLLNMGSHTTPSLALPLLIMSSLLTSGYFLTNIWLMVRVWRRKSIWLPGISPLGDRLP